jgi:DHA2 family multidrug resistance protein-like MFS transporter
MVAMVALQVLVTLGGSFGWTSPASLGLLATAVVVGFLFFRAEAGNPDAFVDFRLFANRTYTGATLSNLLLNAVAGIIIVAMTLIQVGGGRSAQQAGLLTLGYAISIVVFIRFGEKLLQRFGARKPMIWGCLIVAAAILLLMPTNVLLGTYELLAVVAFTLFGIGLAFYATPSTDAALANLPDDQAGAGSGIYKMASSLGASIGVAISAPIFTALSADQGGVNWLPGVLSFAGRQDNVAIREAAFFAFGANLLMIVAAIVSVIVLVPTVKSLRGSRAATKTPAETRPGSGPRS